jgi:hypothetical protein
LCDAALGRLELEAAAGAAGFGASTGVEKRRTLWRNPDTRAKERRAADEINCEDIL